MNNMTSHERFKLMFEHKEADRIPFIAGPWFTTVESWKKEGLPENVDNVNDYFNLDKMAGISADNSPRYEEKTLEENDQYRTYTTSWGATLRNWKHATSTPEFLDFKVKDAREWIAAKKRMTPSEDRIPWQMLKENYSKWHEKGYWIRGDLFFGFDAMHSWVVGTETLLIAMMEEPEWCIDMFNHCLDVNLVLLDRIWDAGYEFDALFWCDDMGYKNNQFFSVNTYRELLKPVHKKAIEWAHRRGIKAHLHSCGDVNPFIPELIEIGLDALNPLEVKAGMDPVQIKKKYGNDLVLDGGINVVLWDDIDALEAEIRRVVPILKESGGYIFGSDHSIPDNVSFSDFKRVVEIYKEVGSYS